MAPNIYEQHPCCSMYYTGWGMFSSGQQLLLLLLLLPLLLPSTPLSFFLSSSSSSSSSFPFLVFFNLNGHPGMVGKSYKIRRCSLSSRSVTFHQMTETLILTEQNGEWFDGKAAAPVPKGWVIGANGTRSSLSAEPWGVKIPRVLGSCVLVISPRIDAFGEQKWFDLEVLVRGRQLHGNQRETTHFGSLMSCGLAESPKAVYLLLNLAAALLLWIQAIPLNFWQAPLEWDEGSS